MRQSIATLLALGTLSLAALTGAPHAAAQPLPPPTVSPKVLAPKVVAPQLQVRPITVSPALKAALAQKRLEPTAAIQAAVSYRGALPLLKIRTRNVVLEPVTAEPVPTGITPTHPPVLATKLKKYEPYFAKLQVGRAIKVPVLPVQVDHKDVQSPIRDQADRGTCVAHASMAALEAVFKRDGKTRDLSENHAYNVFMAREGSNCVADPGLKTYKAADYLTSGRVCLEAQSPYVPTPSATCQVIPPPCATTATFGHVITYKFYSPEFGGTGTNIATNTNYLESLIDAGFDPVLGVYVAGSDWSDGSAESGVVDVQLGAGGNPAAPYGGHAMLLVGYNKTDNYFIFKNSWGADAGHAGYFHLSYEYLQTYAKYGYVIIGAAGT